MKNISIFGTSSDSGKSTLTFIIAKFLQNQGYKVAPFKAQNVSNNSIVADDGSELAIAQAFQAEVLGVTTSFLLNPVLLKIEGEGRTQLIINGKAKKTLTPREYYQDIDTLKPIVEKAFKKLSQTVDIIVAEGAGSPVELNLMNKDLSNIYIAETFDTKIILVADISLGGVFASIYGTYNLLPTKFQKNVIGVVINKFRGDKTLFDDGINIIEKEFNIPVLGVLPYNSLNLGFEDSASLFNYTQDKKNYILSIGIIAYPKMSNFNDFEPLIADENLNVEFIKGNINLDSFDMVILPGSKSVIEDLRWMKQIGLFNKLQKTNSFIFGICGGYQMMMGRICDKYGIENEPTKDNGLGFIKDKVLFKKKKNLKKDIFDIFDLKVDGFLMHNGVSYKYPLYFQNKQIAGTFVHKVFDDDNIRDKFFKALDDRYKKFDYTKYKKYKIDSFVDDMINYIDKDKILNSI
ncbi:MAG: cobyric acid synthase [Arcobacteraceae bacterium]|nr:cobyric acid synthase [Arcobacteraceae bacterium]